MTTTTLPEDLTGLTFVRTSPRAPQARFTITDREKRPDDLVVWAAIQTPGDDIVRLVDVALRGPQFALAEEAAA